MAGRNKRQRTLVAVLAIAMLAGGSLAGAAHGYGVAVGTLALQTDVQIRYPETPCPAGSPIAFQCFARAGTAVVPGLGTVQESYAYLLENAPEGCPAPPPGADSVRLLPTTVRLIVAGKGEIDVSTSGTGCLARFGFLKAPEAFTVTGGSGVYAGASGGGTVTTASFGPPDFSGHDDWSGTLVVPGYEFDLAAPTIKGANNKTVRVPRRARHARVTYTVTAQDDVDGVVPVTCLPRSGALFDLGRTRVTCSATDTSGNTSKVTFTVIVSRTR